MNDGDVLLLISGKLAQVLETNNVNSTGLICIQYIDRDDHSFVKQDELDIAHNLGQGPIALAEFHGIRSIHTRLNRMAKV